MISDDLMERQYAIQTDYFPPDLITELRRDLELRQQAGDMQQAGIGRGNAQAVRGDIRNDVTVWLDGQGAAQNEYLRLMDALRMELNQALTLGLFEFEAHYALYDTGGFYKKHVDALKGQRNRIVSTVTYLTPGWHEQDAGHLVLYHPDDENRECARILPRSGTLAVFMSETVPHEVLPPLRPRASIAGWFRCRV